MFSFLAIAGGSPIYILPSRMTIIWFVESFYIFSGRMVQYSFTYVGPRVTDIQMGFLLGQLWKRGILGNGFVHVHWSFIILIGAYWLEFVIFTWRSIHNCCKL